MTIEEMNTRKRELGYTNEYLAKLSGVPVSTVNKILSGATKAPRRGTILALSAVLKADDLTSSAHKTALSSPARKHDSINYMDVIKDEKVLKVEEPAPAYQVTADVFGYRMGPYTLEDYLALPDEERVELIDGYFFEMYSPTTRHQTIEGQIYHQLCNIIERNNGSCMPAIAPMDVQVDATDKTVVQPDVMVVCNPREKVTRERIVGAPDLIVEVLSPSTKNKDMTIKLNKYYESGVREYWIVDPKSERTLVYDLEHDNYIPEIYDFTESIPIKIWNGADSIDFKKIKQFMNRFADIIDPKP